MKLIGAFCAYFFPTVLAAANLSLGIFSREGNAANEKKGQDAQKVQQSSRKTAKTQSGNTLLEGKISYFYPTDKTTRRIMGGGALFGLESSFKAYRFLYPWISVSILPNSGHSIGEHNKTSMIWVPIGLGLKCLLTSGICDYYLGAGMLPAYLHTKDHSRYVVHSRHKWGFGGIFKLGAIINFRPWFIDIFFDYTLLTMNFSDTSKTVGRRVDLSGFSAGGAIGYRF